MRSGSAIISIAMTFLLVLVKAKTFLLAIVKANTTRVLPP